MHLDIEAPAPALKPTLTQWRMAAMLCLVNAIAFIDRTALPLLIQPMKRHLGISDTQISLLIGAAFILTYTVGGSVIGILVDRFPRRRILAAGIGIWGVATIFCGMATSFTSLFLGRCSVGAGESACGPASMSLIKDSFAPQFRGRAVAIWAMGASLGAGTALIAGGAILHFIGETGTITVPVLGVIQSWQVVLVACGLFSLPVALLVFTFPEPARQSSSPDQKDNSRNALASIGKGWRVFLPLFIANAATIMLWTSYTIWLPALFGRTWKIPAGEIGLTFGIIIMVFSTSSQFIGGFLIDLARRRYGLPAVPVLGAVVCMAIFFPAILIPSASSLQIAWCLVAVFILGASGLFTIGTAMVVHLAPSASVGKIAGIHFSWVGITGSAIAPTVIALIAEHAFGGTPDALGRALSGAGGIFAVTGCLCLLAVASRLRMEGKGAGPIAIGKARAV